jgi:ribonuclease M5
MDEVAEKTRGEITKADFVEAGLSGGPESSAKRQALQKKLSLPEHLSANGLLQAVNLLYSREAFLEMLSQEEI